jgi:urease accessory protein
MGNDAMIITSIAGRLADLKDDFSELDTLLLTAEQRQRPHMRTRSQSGRDLAISLERGVTLEDGDVLCIDGRTAIVVEAAPEDLIEILPVSAREWGTAAYQLGNLHRDVRFLDRSMLTPWDATSAEVLRGMKVRFERVSRGFVGERFGAYTGHLHDQQHAHAHGHAHDHPHGHIDHEHAH